MWSTDKDEKRLRKSRFEETVVHNISLLELPDHASE